MKDNHYIKPAIMILDLVLCVVLVVLMFQYRKDTRVTQERLTQESLAAVSEAEESKAKEKAEKEKTKTEKEKNKQTRAEETTGLSETSSQDVSGDVTGKKFSFRGDSFCDTEDKEREGLGAIIKAVLDFDDYNVEEFEDYSIGNAGSMSQMAFAGVDMETCESFLTKHELNGISSDEIYEHKIRTFSEEDLKRSDYDAIPIICIGYYGGWGEDVEELIQQQQLILDTYDETDEFLIVGTAANAPDSSAYNRAMREAWGEHYLAINDSSSDEFRSAEEKGTLANKIVEKLENLGYIRAGE